MNDNALQIWCPAWGEKHINLLRDYALPSLMDPRNLPACGFGKIHVVGCGLTHEEGHLSQVLADGMAGLPVEIEVCSSPVVRDPMHGLRWAMHAAVCRGTRLLLLMPDSIYGPGSVANIFNYARGKAVTVAAAHCRVNEDLYMSRYGKGYVWPDNRALVKAAFEMGALDVCDTNKDNVTWLGAIAWTQIAPDTRLLIHYMPTPYLCWITPEDEQWWSRANTFGNWDHTWPVLLHQQQRLRVVGSSDIFWLVEMESPQRSGALKPAPNSAGQELYHHRRPHNDACGSFLIEVRG